MKTTRTIPFVVVATLFFACNSPEKQVEQASANVEEAKQDLSEAEWKQQKANADWEAYKDEQEMKIQENERMISEYR